MNMFKDYYCTTFRKHSLDGDSRDYLFIKRRVDDAEVTSFRIAPEKYQSSSVFTIKYHAGWDTYAPLILEYVVNELKINNLYIDDEYYGH